MPRELLFAMVLLTATETSAQDGPSDPDPGVAFERAARLLAEGDRDRAYLALVQLTDAGSPFPEAYLFRGSIERERGELETARQVFRRGLERDPSHRSLRLELAVTLSWEGRTREALAAYETVLARDPADIVAALGRARMLFWLGRHAEAIAAYRTILEREPRSTEALTGLADVHRARLQRRRARSLYDRALAIDPELESARQGRAALPAATRAEVRADLGLMLDGEVAGRGGLGLTVHATPEVLLVATFRQDVQRNELALARTGGASVVLRPDGALAYEVGYQVQRAGQERAHRLQLGLSWRATDRWTLSASTRPGVREDGRLEHLTSVGSEHRVGVFRWSVRLFRGDQPEQRETVGALAATLDWSRIGIRLGVAQALATTSYTTAGVQLRWSVSPRHDLVGSYEYFTLGQRHLLSVGYRVRL